MLKYCCPKKPVEADFGKKGKAMKYVNKADRFFQKILFVEKALGALSLFIMLCICFFAVIMRYVFNDPWTWSEEVILILLVIFGFLCISIDIYNDGHIALTFLYNRLPAGVQKALDVLRHVLIGGFFYLFAKYGLQIYQIKWKKPLPATGWSQGIIYVAQITVSILIVFFCVMNVLKVLLCDKKPNQSEEEAT